MNQTTNFTVSAIVPAYNEALTIEGVILNLLAISFLDEIIVIDDGSSDDTPKILGKYHDRVTVITNQKNSGKGYSVARGLEIAYGDLIVLLDSDIVNYTEMDLKLLIDPVIKNESDFTLKPARDKIFHYLSGIRCYRRVDLMPLIEPMKHSGKFGLEVLLNKRLKDKNGKFVKLSDYHHLQKFEKYTLPKALWEYTKEGLSILREMLRQV